MEGALSILNLPYQFDVPWKKVRLWWILFVLPFSCPRALVVRRLVKWAVPIARPTVCKCEVVKVM